MRLGAAEVLAARKELTSGDYIKSKNNRDNQQLGLMNKYLNGYAGKLGCNISTGVGDIRIDRKEYVNVRSQQAANTVDVFAKRYDDRSNAIDEMDEINAAKKKGKYNFGGYVTKGSIEPTVVEEF